MAFGVWLETRSVNPFAGGKHFGSVGAYDLISGVAHYSVDPSETTDVVDIGKVPTNADGKVEFTADVHILKPRNLANWNRRIFFMSLIEGTFGTVSISMMPFRKLLSPVSFQATEITLIQKDMPVMAF